MGRLATTASRKTTLMLDPKLKHAATFYALKHGLTLSALVERGLRLAMKETER